MAWAISELARAAGCSAPAVRHYESLGLMPVPARKAGRRLYGGEDLARLRFILGARACGMGLADIATLLARPGCAEALPLLRDCLAAIARQQAELARMALALTERAAACGGGAETCAACAPLALPV